MAEKITRRERVLRMLQSRPGHWIDAPMIASPDIGGSEGLRRIRELRSDGWDIEVRRHPDRRRAVRQYRLRVGDKPIVVNPLKPHAPVWVQGHFRDKPPQPSEVTTMADDYRWEPFNHTYGPWFRLRAERNGLSVGLNHKGHPVDVVVMPDMNRSSWFWTVSFAAYTPRDPRKVGLKGKRVGGRSSTKAEAQQQALDALRLGRPA